jgi:tRNA pseudouridine13 synthase
VRLKQRSTDFQIREMLEAGVVGEAGEHRVYRVTKRKLTTEEAARALAEEAGVAAGEVAFAGLKDRQGVAIQHMSVPVRAGVRDATIDGPELKVVPMGWARAPLGSAASRGNAFELSVRDLGQGDLGSLRANLPFVRDHGVVNYFDEQRFGNLRFDQGWIARDLMLGRHEEALRALLCAESGRDDERHARFKRELRASWGDWRECRDVAGRHGAHHSIFEHLARHAGDFAGAFTYVAARLRLIHLYAFQSHLWNRAVAAHLIERLAREERVVLDSLEGPLVMHTRAQLPLLAPHASFRLPGEGLDDVVDPEQRSALARALEREGLRPEQFRIDGVSGFRLKGEDRPLLCLPRHLRVRPPERDALNRDRQAVKVRFELPRGAYATLVVRRLFAPALGEDARADRPESRRGATFSDGRDRGRRGASSTRANGPDRRRDGRRRGNERGRNGGPGTWRKPRRSE